MRTATTSTGSRRTFLRLLPRLGLLLAAIAVVLLALVPLGWRAGWWGYRFSLLDLMAYAAYCGIAAAALAVVALALATARGEGWTIVAADPAAGRIEATARSLWMGFADDIVVRIVAAGSGSRIDMRSASRHGRSDLGVNAARIRAYFAALRARAKEEEGEQ